MVWRWIRVVISSFNFCPHSRLLIHSRFRFHLPFSNLAPQFLSMELPKTFDPKGMDQRWYDRWMEKKLFESKPDDRDPYTIVMPPPNVTGVLHMGHALNNTIQDILIRRAKMQGFNTCWVPGTDHASIATEAKVVGMLRERGID